MLGRFNKKDEAAEPARPQERSPEAAAAVASATRQSDAAAKPRPAASTGARMIVPEGVTIEGNISGAAETEIHGHVKGDLDVKGRLFLGQTSVVTGNVHAAACRIDGSVEGTVECSEEVQLGSSGRLSADVTAGKQIEVAGRVNGNVTTPGILRLAAGSCIEGDVRTRRLMMEEGATVNGRCTMRSGAKSGDGKESAS